MAPRSRSDLPVARPRNNLRALERAQKCPRIWRCRDDGEGHVRQRAERSELAGGGAGKGRGEVPRWG